jgi:putative restriction endonuclease
VIGTIAVTDEGWYRFLHKRPEIQEVNFWRPSARRGFVAPEFSPFLFKLRAPHNAVCGFGYFATYSALPLWLAWETFGFGNGTPSLEDMIDRLARIRQRIGYVEASDSGYIGCTLIVQPVFFPPEGWIRQPSDWPARTQTDKKYDLTAGEGRRVWEQCIAVARELGASPTLMTALEAERYGAPVLLRPRLGQNTFRIAVMDAYHRACAITEEHSLPALEAGHIRPYGEGGLHEVSNGILMRADLHRLFDKGYITVTPDLHVVVSERLRNEFHNGRTYRTAGQVGHCDRERVHRQLRTGTTQLSNCPAFTPTRLSTGSTSTRSRRNAAKTPASAGHPRTSSASTAATVATGRSRVRIGAVIVDDECTRERFASYSSRSARTGSSRAARNAGSSDAARATMANPRAATP